MNEIEKSSLFTSILDKSLPIDIEIIENQPAFILKNEEQAYITQTLKNALSLNSIYQALCTTHLMLSSSVKIEEVSKAEYLRLVLDHKYIKTSTILDSAIILVSDIFWLGIPHQSTSLKALRENHFTKDTKSVEILRGFQKRIQDSIKKRNKIVHRGELSDEHLDLVQYIDYKMEKGSSSMSIEAKQHALNNIYEHKKNELKSNNDLVETFLIDLFNSLDEVFNNRIKKFNILMEYDSNNK